VGEEFDRGQGALNSAACFSTRCGELYTLEWRSAEYSMLVSQSIQCIKTCLSASCGTVCLLSYNQHSAVQYSAVWFTIDQ
jgi:hypothetical protein